VNDRHRQELTLLRTRYPDLELVEDGLWARIRQYPVPSDLWNVDEIDVAFQIPESVGQAPYAFYVHPPLALKSGATIKNYTSGATPFDGEWGKFSWQITWQPAEEIHAGTTMLNFVSSFAERLREGS
jgi:hypothetical protein